MNRQIPVICEYDRGGGFKDGMDGYTYLYRINW